MNISQANFFSYFNDSQTSFEVLTRLAKNRKNTPLFLDVSLVDSKLFGTPVGLVTDVGAGESLHRRTWILPLAEP